MSDRKLAEKLYRMEHPRDSHCPYERQMQLNDLWPADQEKYIERVRNMRRLLESEP